MNYNIISLSGDGIGKEIINSAVSVLDKVGKVYGHQFNVEDCLIGGIAIDNTGSPLPEETKQKCLNADAVLLGAVGGDKWDNCTVRPEIGLLEIRKLLELYANIRPAKLYPSLIENSSLKDSITQQGIDLVIVRELTGGIYFGERGFRQGVFGREGFDTECYSEIEIERIARIAYELAQTRTKKLCLVDKANVLISSKLWRKIVTDINEDYPDVRLEMMYIDNACMQLAIRPSQFDVVLTSNMFGDIMSDLAAAVVGSIGVMPSASLGNSNLGMYEAIHGSAPTIAGLGIANPIGTILSAAMMLKHSFDLQLESESIERACEETLNAGIKTYDLQGEYNTAQITKEIINRIR